jgi:glutaconyl-CoA/methylmalonyl-CoA decarboxylase subunit gamma
VEVAPDLTSVVVDGRRHPLRVVRNAALKVELEIEGETVVVDNWPDHFPDPPGPVDVNGERATAAVERLAGGGPAPPAPAAARASSPAAADTGPAAEAAGATAVVPPMPGKVIEVRVREGQAVEPGEVLLILEAMKMRNEVTSPIRGTVRTVRVAAGANVRARETMLLLDPR